MEQGNPRRSTFTAHRMLIKLTETKPSCPRGSARTYSTIYASKEPECKESVKRVKIIRGVKKKKRKYQIPFLSIFSSKSLDYEIQDELKCFINSLFLFLFADIKRRFCTEKDKIIKFYCDKL